MLRKLRWWWGRRSYRRHALATAKAIEQNAIQFNPCWLWHKVEGTPAYLASWTVAVLINRRAPHDVDLRRYHTSNFESIIKQVAADALGLDQASGARLFAMMPYGRDLHDDIPTAAEAVAVLRHLAKTGEVEWPART